MPVSAKGRLADSVARANGRLAGLAANSDGRRTRRPPWWFALPALVLFAFVVLVPSARGLYYAVTDWDGLDPTFSFIGLGNFTEMLEDPDALQAVWHTLVIAVAITLRDTGPMGRDMAGSFAGRGTAWRHASAR